MLTLVAKKQSQIRIIPMPYPSSNLNEFFPHEQFAFFIMQNADQ